MLSSRIFWLQSAVAKRSVTNLTKLSSQEKIVRNRFSDSEVFEPFLNYDDIFNLVDSITWQDLAKRKMQFGHHVQVRDPYMAKYILGNRSGIDIIDLDKVSVVNYCLRVEFTAQIIKLSFETITFC